ncbi:hypothetical protein ES319_D13G169700v1 [Gossypium barbadense]|uniref:Cysteine-rich transmembrane domain-containing protein n=1 Tax=Gossypium barbadense TaxID=3634 RepID=A0A5J5NNG7_GOSBA|nr:hypothetical protein ES319_D13G169700v1 [Gossypium barbadense]
MVEYDQYDAKADIPTVPTPPNPNCVAPQMAYQPPNPMGQTESKGNGFWSGFCSGLCCYCCLDMCF